MKGLVSALGALAAFENEGSRVVVDVIDASPIDLQLVHGVCGNLDDWESLEAPDGSALLEMARLRHFALRCRMNLEDCFRGLSDDLERELLAEVEEHLKAYAIRDQILNALLCAPLSDPYPLGRIIQNSLSEGYNAVSTLLEIIREAQPTLSRLTDKWLTLGEELFAPPFLCRQRIWRMAVESGAILRTIEAPHFRDVQQAWVNLAFNVESPAQRASIGRVANGIAAALFPTKITSNTLLPSESIYEDTTYQQHKVRPDGKSELDRALKQVDAITTAVSLGNDGKARQFLRELISTQLAHNGGEEFAVKSLCNIAQQCAEMFRTDFEFECLAAAIDLNQSDGWTLIQLADHFKRVGQFNNAIETLQRASETRESVIAASSLADVYVQMGRFEDALQAYRKIQNFEHDPALRGAVADALRRWGKLDEARAEYDHIVREGMATHRIQAGRAEIAKREGRIKDSCEIYSSLLKDPGIENTAIIVYKLAFTNVLMRLGELSEAYKQVDEVVQLRPFSRNARAIRAAIIGLLGKADDALKDLPYLGQTRAFNEWVNDYVRGLLLLLARRYDDARKALLQKVEDRFLTGDAGSLLRLGAAVCFLRTRDGINLANESLSHTSEMKDQFADSIRSALQYHVAVALGHANDISRLERQLNKTQDEDLRQLVNAVRTRDWKKAWSLEIRVLLRLQAAA